MLFAGSLFSNEKFCAVVLIVLSDTEEPHKMNMIFLLCLLVLVDFFCGALASRLPDCLAQGLANSLFMKDVPHIHLLDQANGNFCNVHCVVLCFALYCVSQ